jgi:cellobionic acid phosphorylase
LAQSFREGARQLNDAVNRQLWDGEWFARGITDDGVVFGTGKDGEGRIFLNPQSWAILAGTADEAQRGKMLHAIEQQLETPYGETMFAPAFTAMRDDVGRVTQKYPGSAENGAVYNHAAIFYIYSLYDITESERAYRLLRQMIPGPDGDDYLQRGQLPVFIPNYYRGAYYQFPRTAGRSSQLFNTGTVSWVYRCLVEGLFGLQGQADGLRIAPQLPADWRSARVVRTFRGAEFVVAMEREAGRTETSIVVDGKVLEGAVVREVVAGRQYQVAVRLPG